MSRATDDAFDALHALTAESMADELKRNLERARLPKDDADYEPLSPKLLGVIRAFLKDNGIDTPASTPRFNSITEQLRDLDVGDPALN